MNITIAGTGYVGLVTGVCLSEIGHDVTCVDVDQDKVDKMKKGIAPIYEPGLEELMVKNIYENRLHFTTDQVAAYRNAEVIYIAVGTPENEDGSANLSYINSVATDIGLYMGNDVIVVTKSTVPVGTNDKIENIIVRNKPSHLKVEMVSNPEFLREGSAIQDTFHGDRIVIGSRSESAIEVIEAINKPYGIPIMKTDILSAEMIKYSSNAFLATKISFINEIANICEKLGANIEDVSRGIGMDNRIGPKFLQAGIGYGGSCFPKDTKALVQIAGNVEHNFELLESVIKVNNNQQTKLVEKAVEHIGPLRGKNVTILGLAFKPNTDDVREAASQVITKQLINQGAHVTAYDPIAINNTKRILGNEITYTTFITEALTNADVVFIVTEWEEIKQTPMSQFIELMKTPIIFDGRNCFDLEEVKKYEIVYYSIGREFINFKHNETKS